MITNGIQISVNPDYDYDNQDMSDEKSLFTYEITIKNHSTHTVQLIERNWNIFDSLGGMKEVHGPGVVGKQPVLEPQHSFSYTSWCPLESEIGFMEGSYTMLNLDDDTHFEVKIPRFFLIAPYRMN
jgi:ApaG protein